YVYFFKRKKEKEHVWKFEYSGIQPLDTTQLNMEDQIIETNRRFSESDVEKLISEALDEIEMMDRRRASLYYPRTYSLTNYLEQRLKEN
ncbi:MAG: hypothetical protein ACK4ND_17555, partial [Cytophagaceae bacterium]